MRLLDVYSEKSEGKVLSGRKLSLLLGKSANHLSQMLNDGLVPAGETILNMARLLELNQAQTDHLIRKAMETKAHQRSRDHFWIQQTTRMLKQADLRLATCRRFIEESGLEESFSAWSKQAGAREA